MYNADFNTAAYEEIMIEAGLNRFIMSVKQRVSRTNSKEIIAKRKDCSKYKLQENVNALPT